MSLNAILLALAAAIAGAAPSHPHKPHRLNVPDNIQVPAGSRLMSIAHAAGTQNYICLASANGVAWTFLGPQATLFEKHKQVATHFLSPNPDEDNLPRATWQDSDDTSAVWAVAIESSTDPTYVADGAIPWLLLRVVGAQFGPKWGDNLVKTMFIQRINTQGGVAPATGCAGVADVGKRAMVPYETDYAFYK